MTKKERRIVTATVAIWLIAFLGLSFIYGTAAYVVFHFVVKYW